MKNTQLKKEKDKGGPKERREKTEHGNICEIP